MVRIKEETFLKLSFLCSKNKIKINFYWVKYKVTQKGYNNEELYLYNQIMGKQNK